MARNRITKRTGGRLKRLAYDMADLAVALRGEGWGYEAELIAEARALLNSAANSILEKTGA